MNHWKRILCIFLVVCLIVSLFAGLNIIFAQTGTLSKNTAARHITCTSLSTQAQAYYTAGTYDYATISAMHGVYSTDSWTVTQNNPVYTNLQRLMIDTHTNTNVAYSGYGTTSLAYYWNYTDCISSSADYVLFYCDKLMNNVHETTGRDGMEREHIWPQSKADYYQTSGTGGADLHHLRPSYGYINGIKSNRAFANVTNGTACTLDGETVFTYTSGGTSGWMEVNDNIKGDIARILLYVYVRWGQPNLYSDYGSNISQKLKTAGVNTSGNIDNSDDGSRIIESLDTLLEWMEIDPVDTWEMQRNDKVERVQGNRNVFIDYPEYAWIMFGLADRMPTDMDTPSGMAKNGAPASYAITKVNVNNPSWGSAVITDDRTITVMPAPNYFLQNATASSGTVAINGNTITVSNMTANTTVNVILAQTPQYTVSYNVLGSVTDFTSVNQGSSLTLPTEAAAIDGYDFIGWTTAAVDPETVTMPTVLTGSYTPTANTTLYAVYEREYINPNPKPAGYSLSNEGPEAGDSVILARFVSNKYYALTTANTPGNTALTIDSSGVVSTPGNTTWTVVSAERGVSLQPTGANTYLHMNSNALQVTNGTDNAGIVFTSNGDGTYKATRADGARWITTSGLRGLSCSQNEQNAASLYVFKYHDGEASSTTYFTTNPTCPHTSTMLSGYVAATCTENGYTGDTVCVGCGMIMNYGTAIPAPGHEEVTDPAVAETCTAAGKTEGSHCSVCGEVIIAQTTIPALGHNYTSEVTTAATCTTNGVKTYTCARCHDSYTESIQKLGHSYDNGVVTTAATCGAKGVKTFTCARCHSTYTQDIPATENHTYTSSITTAATCTTAGVLTYTCSVCGAKYTETISATGHNFGSATNTNNASYHTYYCQNSGCTQSYTEAHHFSESTSGAQRTFTCTDCGYSYNITLNTYVVTYNDQGVETRANVIEGSSVTPPATASAADGFTFVGWSFSPYTTETTSVILQSAPFTPTGDTTLYAVYSRTEEGGDENTFSLVTDASQLASGKKVIIAAKDYNFAMSSVLSNYYRGQAIITKNGNKAVISDGVHTFTLGTQNGKWSLKDTADSKYLTAYISGSYYDLGTEDSVSDNGKFTVTISPDGTAALYSNTDCYIRYTCGGSYDEFVCRSAATDDYDIALYIEAPSSTTYYTSTPHPKETYTVSYSELGTVTDTDAVLEGDSITLPATAAAAAGYEFLGWVDAQIYNETTEEPVILTGSYTPTGSVTLYAAYMRTQPGEGPAASLVKMNAGDTLRDGDKIVIIANGTDYVMYQQTRSGSYVMYKDVADTLTARTVANDEKYYFDVTAVSDGYKLGDATNGYLYNNTSNNLACSTDNYSAFTLTDNEDGTFYLKIGSRWLTSRTDLTTSNANYWRLNSGSGSKNLDIYKYTPGAVDILFYTTNPTGTEECAHISTTTVDAVDATCTANGYTGDVVCDICGETVTPGEVITMLGHDYAASVVSPATYLADGEMGYTCSRCEDSYTEVIPQLIIGAADTGDYVVVTEGSDDLSGTYLIVYEDGGIAFNGSLGYPNTSGNYQSVTISDGVVKGSSTVDALAVTIAKVEGTNTYTILLGSNKYIGNTGNSAELNYNTALYYNTITVDELCNAVIANASGRNTYYFRFNPAGNSDRFSFYAASTGYSVKLYKRVECEHTGTHIDGFISATCTTAGFTGNTVCDDCGAIVIEGTEITALGHDIVIDNGYAATCTAAGLTDGDHCSRCDYTVAQEVIPALGHSYTSEVTTAATCAQDGVQTYTCSRCNDSYTEAIPALGHSYNENGICTVCSDRLIRITSAYLRLDEDIDVIYTADIPEGATASMTFTMNGQSVTVADDGTHEFAFEGVNPQCMGDNISAALTVTVGESTYTCTKETYSVRTYCVNKLADETLTAEARKLVSDTLAYGAAAQTYMSYETESLVNSGSDIENPTYSTYTSLSGLAASFTGTAAEYICWVGAGLTLTDNVAMNFRFYAESTDGLSVNVTINGRTQTFTEFAPVEGMENVYEISFKGIKAAEFDDSVSASFFRNGSAVGNTVSYSVNTYVCSKQADSNTALANLVKALYNYGASAAAYAE